MVLSPQTLDEAARLMEAHILQDTLQLYTTSPAPVTVGFDVVRPVVPQGGPVAGLVQSTALAGALGNLSESDYSIKVARGTHLVAGMVVEVISCREEPSLDGKRLLVDTVSMNGSAMLRKALGRDFGVVNQEGKGEL